jgi:hypothetical protein
LRRRGCRERVDRHTAVPRLHTKLAFFGGARNSMHAVAAVAATFAAIFEPELVQLYEPPVPTLTAARTGCPHTTGTLLDWHNAATWNGAGVPSTAGADVTLPSSSRVLLSRSAANVTFGTLHVPAGAELVIGEHADGIALHATGVALFMIWKRVNSGEIVLVQVDGRKSMIEAVDPPQP